MCSINLLNNDLQFILISFLKPRDILKYRYTSTYSNKIVTSFLEKTKKTSKLLLLMCPLCGNDWLNQESIENLTSFKDLNDNNFNNNFNNNFICTERITFITKFFSDKDPYRRHLFCKNCEDTSLGLFTKRTFMMNYKLKNFCNYQLHIDYFSKTWIFITSETSNGLAWNEYNYNTFIDEYKSNWEESVDRENDYQSLEWEHQNFYRDENENDDELEDNFEDIESHNYEMGYEMDYEMD